MLPRSHPLAGVDGAYNAVYVEAEAAGRLMFYGPGRGRVRRRPPRCSGDLVAVARNRVAGGRGPRESAYAALPIQPMGQVPTRYHISLDVEDRAGVLAAVAGAFADAGRLDLDGPAGGPRRRRDAGGGHPHRAGRGAGRAPSSSWADCRIGPQGDLGDARGGGVLIADSGSSQSYRRSDPVDRRRRVSAGSRHAAGGRHPARPGCRCCPN